MMKLMRELITKFKEHSRDIGIISMFLIPIILFVLMERLFSNESVVLRIDLFFLYVNVVFWELFLLFLFFLLNSLKVAVVIQTIIMFILGLINHYLMAFRGSPFQPWDIFSVYTALSVAGNYTYSLTISDIIICVGFLAVLCWGFTLRLKIKREQRYYYLFRIVSAFVIGMVLALSTTLLQNDKLMSRVNMFTKLFVQEKMVSRNGTAVTLLYDLQFLIADKPEGYSDEKAQELLEKASDEYVSSANTEDLPNIVVIVSESFSDLSVIRNFETNVEFIPFIDSMLAGGDNIISGYLTVPVLGGNTANSEFEYLTASSMRWFNMSSVPYQQYINHPMESMASNLKNQGYKTVAIHPYGRKGWNRDKVYGYFGFDEYISEESFDDPVLIREYISDRSDYDKIIEEYEANKDESPVFIFNVTMQNHGAYFIRYENFTPDIFADEIEDIEFNQYLSLIHVTDEETKRLIDYFSLSDKPVIVVFFGDHQPNDTTVDELYSDVGLDVFNLDTEEKTRRYQVPFFVWANYEIPEENGVMTTPYGLGIKTMEISGAEMSDYERFVSEYLKGRFSDDDYKIVQYYKVFDEKN